MCKKTFDVCVVISIYLCHCYAWWSNMYPVGNVDQNESQCSYCKDFNALELNQVLRKRLQVCLESKSHPGVYLTHPGHIRPSTL